MGQRMQTCPECGNKVRDLYEWKGNVYCGMCQQENIEVYESTIIFRFFLFWRLSIDYQRRIFSQVIFPKRGWIRRFFRKLGEIIRIIIAEVRDVVSHVRTKVRKAEG